MSKRIPLNKALIWIFLSTLLISGSATLGWLYYLHVKRMRTLDDDFKITSVIHYTAVGEKLSNEYVSELLEVSVDEPINLYTVSTETFRQKLLKSPIIEKATVKRNPPSALYVEYTLRTPIAYLGDYENVGFDKNGATFPFSPFLTPKNLPVFIMGQELWGEEGFSWGRKLEGNLFDDALQVLDLFHGLEASHGWKVNTVDMSKAYAPSYGQKEIVVELEERELKPQPITVFLRLNVDEIKQNVANFLVLRKQLKGLEIKPVTTIDMRIPQIAFLNLEPAANEK